MLFKDYMGGGLSAGQAKAIGGSIATAVSTAGSTISDATALTASKNIITTNAAATQGVKLVSMNAGESQIVYNATATQFLLYPGSSTIAINQRAVGVGVYVPAYTVVEFHQVSSTLVLGNMSA